MRLSYVITDLLAGMAASSAISTEVHVPGVALDTERYRPFNIVALRCKYIPSTSSLSFPPLSLYHT